MIVYQCGASWIKSKMFRKYSKRRVSDKDKRRYDRFKTYRRIWFWHSGNWDQRHNV